MPFDWQHLEGILRWVCGGITIGSMTIAVFRVVWNLSRVNRQMSGQPYRALRNPWYYILGSVIFAAILALLWIPVRLNLPNSIRITADISGAMLLLAGLAGYQWGHITLGKMLTSSSSSGAPLFNDHRLIREGPYRITRHPMYLTLQVATLGSLMLYRN